MKEVKIHKPNNSTINIMLWGREGVGKTYLSASMPKKALYLTFDPNALNGINDLVIDGKIDANDVPYITYDEGDYKEIANAYKNPRNPFFLNEMYSKNKFETLIIDSLTSYFKLALQYGVEFASMLSEKEKSTIERPGYAGYGVRSVATKEMAFNVINWCTAHGVNCVFIAHEGEMEKDQNTGIMYRLPTLSGDIPSEIARNCDESWYLYASNDGKRSLLVHPMDKIRPLKTRMFANDVQSVNADNLNLSKLIDAWRSLGKINNQALENLQKGV